MQNADGQYGYNKPWQLLNETIAAQRTWNQASDPWHPDIEGAEPVEYMMWQNAGEWIRQNEVPPRNGWRNWKDQLTIFDILDNVFSRCQASPHTATEIDDYSGVQGGYDSSMRPTGAGGSGVT